VRVFQTGKGSGFGKVILFNEHFVVHGVPGIASAIESTACAEARTVEKGISIVDVRTGAEDYAEKKRTQQMDSVGRMFKTMGLDLDKVFLKIRLGGDLPGFSGIGASAASSVAVARAIAEELELDLTSERINEIAYEAEKAYAGNPSGIDNTVATFGGLIWFKRSMSGNPNTIEKLTIEEPVEIVIGNTGVVADTKEMVAGVARRRIRDPEKYDRLFRRAEELVVAARDALLASDLHAVGKLMNENHTLLQGIEVSSKDLDFLVNLARDRGALGAKLTGGGGGGCMVALTPERTLQDKVAAAIEKEGFQVLKTRIGIQECQACTAFRKGES